MNRTEPSSHLRVAVWIDHHEARVFRILAEGFEQSTTGAPAHHVHRHPKGAEGYKEHPSDADRFFHDVARSLEGAGEILVLGPATAKLELLRHLHRHDPALEPKVVGVETVDHPTDPQIAAYARRYFKAADRLR
jgi:hypothetical protein